MLAPGLRVLRRSRTQLQIGLLRGHRVLVPDSEPVRRTLGRLLRGEALDDAASRAVLGTLAPVLVDAAGLVVPGVAPGDVAAAALLDPDGYARRLEARRNATVSVAGALGDRVDPVPLLSAAGLRVGDDRRPAVVLVLGVGELRRDALDPLVRTGVPHLPVRLVEGTAVVGPFVDPGRTACLRCLDAHQCVDDPRAGILADRHAAAAGDRQDGVPEPVDTALATIAVAWAVRDLVTYVEGGRPTTWSSTVELTPTLTEVTRAEWLRHPACGCGWLEDETTATDEEPSRTMGA